MQLTPSISLDPNLLASLFSAASASASSPLTGDPVSHVAAAEPTAAFDAVFAALGSTAVATAHTAEAAATQTPARKLLTLVPCAAPMMVANSNLELRGVTAETEPVSSPPATEKRVSPKASVQPAEAKPDTSHPSPDALLSVIAPHPTPVPEVVQPVELEFDGVTTGEDCDDESATPESLTTLDAGSEESSTNLSGPSDSAKRIAADQRAPFPRFDSYSGPASPRSLPVAEMDRGHVPSFAALGPSRIDKVGRELSASRTIVEDSARATAPTEMAPGLDADDAERMALAIPAPRRGEPTPVKRAPTGALERANFAVGDSGRPDPAIDAPKASEKRFLSLEDQILTRHKETIGIDVAKSVPAMPALNPTMPLTHPTSEYATTAHGVMEVTGSERQAEAPNARPQAVADAHRAVDVVLNAVDRVASREATSVKLEFSVGDTELVVRVELHANEVRTTFRTDSAELRAALAQEWCAVSGGDNTVRLAPAVFADSGKSDAGNSSFGDTSSRHHERQTARHDNQASPGSAFGRSTSSTPDANPENRGTEMPHHRFAPAGTAQRLNLFA